jgi:hypothetical protein
MHVHTWGGVLDPSVSLGVLPGARHNLSVAPLDPSCNPTTIRNMSLYPFLMAPLALPSSPRVVHAHHASLHLLGHARVRARSAAPFKTFL